MILEILKVFWKTMYLELDSLLGLVELPRLVDVGLGLEHVHLQGVEVERENERENERE